MSAEVGELSGSRLQRIDGPRKDLFAFTLHRPDRHGVLVFSLGRRPELGWVDERPRGEPASSFVRLLRKHLENARIVSATAAPGEAVLHLRRAESTGRLRFVARPANLIVEVDDRIVGSARAIADGPSVDSGPFAASFAEMVERGPALVERVFASETDRQRRVLDKAIRRRIAKLGRRLIAIEGDLNRVDEVADLRHRAGLLLSSLHEISRDAVEAVVKDWASDPPSTLRLPIGPGRTPREEADALHARAGRFERGGRIALERHESTERERDALIALRSRIDEGDELDGIEADARRLGVRSAPATGSRGSAPREPFRHFEGLSGRAILVGRSAKDNDALTLSARPWDHWLHARGVTGSHVVVPLSKGESCPPELLLDAAHLAAHYSSVSGEPIVDIQHCPRRFVRKPRGVAAGAVILSREKVLALRVEKARLVRLLR